MNRKNGRHFDGFCPALALVLRLGLLYAAWLLCRIVFFLQNRAEIGPLAASELRSYRCGCANGGGTARCCSGFSPSPTPSR